MTSQPVIRLRPPDLIIQDELHLISGALGTTVGLFEAAVDELCRWPRRGATGPKIVASTATMKRAPEQVRGLFARDLAIFPPPVLDIGDTFFSRQVPVTPQTPGRRYLGVCAHGVRLKSAEIRLAEILLIAGQSLFDRLRRGRRPVPDRGRLLQRDPGTGRDAAVPGRRRGHPGPQARPAAGIV